MNKVKVLVIKHHKSNKNQGKGAKLIWLRLHMLWANWKKHRQNSCFSQENRLAQVVARNEAACDDFVRLKFPRYSEIGPEKHVE